MTDQSFERAVRDWLDDGSDKTPRPAIEAVLLAVRTTPQEWGVRIPPRSTRIPSYLRYAAVVAVIAVVGVGTLTYLAGGPGLGGATPTPSRAPTATPTVAPSPSPSQEIGAFSSPLYGYSVNSGWLVGYDVTPATVRWPKARAFEGLHPEWFDVFIANNVNTGADPAPSVGFMGVGAQPIPDGISANEWMVAYAEGQAASSYACKGPADAWVGAVVGTLEIRRIDIVCDGRFPSGEDATGFHAVEVVFVLGDTGYVMRGNPRGVDALLGSFRPG